MLFFLLGQIYNWFHSERNAIPSDWYLATSDGCFVAKGTFLSGYPFRAFAVVELDTRDAERNIFSLFS